MKLRFLSLALSVGGVLGKRRRKPLSARLRREDPLNTLRDAPWRDSVERAAHYETDFDCESSLMLDFILDLVNDMGYGVFETLHDNGIFDTTTYIKALVDSNEGDEYIGVSGKYTSEHKENHRNIADFWNGTDDIQFSLTLLMGMHGDELSDKYTYFEQVLFLANPDASLEEIEDSAEYWRKYIEDTIGYDNPLLTFNAFAASFVDTENDHLLDRIVIGDGLLSFFEEVGVGPPGRAYVHAHEMAHHVQFDLGVEERFKAEPKESRRKELMADCFAAYYLAHEKGANLDLVPICKVYNAAVAVGDCDVKSEGHHGTPAQRECAAMWGASLARDWSPDEVMDPSDFVEYFDANLEKILLLDQELCPENDDCEYLQSVINAKISETAAEVLSELFHKVQHD